MASSFPAPRVLNALVLSTLALALTGCQYMPCVGGYGNCQEEEITIDPETIKGNGLCLPAYGDEIVSADMSGSGNRVLMITTAKPATLPEDASWPSDSRALTVLDLGESQTTRHLATTWDATDFLVPYGTPEEGESAADGVRLDETMAEVQVDDSGSRFVVAVNRRDVATGYAKLYSGTVPAQGAASFSPETNDLTLVALNQTGGSEPIQSFALSPDGNKVAAAVGAQAELRVMDLSSPESGLSVFETNKDGKGVVVSHKLPDPCLGIACRRAPAITSRGLMRYVWSNDAKKLAVVRTDSAQVPGQSSLWILDVASGKLDLVRSFKDSSAPHVAWAADGASLYVMNTPFAHSAEAGETNSDSAFGPTLIRRMAAAAGGKEMGSGARLPRSLGWKTEPVGLTVLKDGQSLVFLWENRLYRLDMPGGSFTGAKQEYLLGTNKVPRDLRVLTGGLAASATTDTVMYLVEDSIGARVGLRTSASDNAACSTGGAPAAEDAPAEGDAAEGAAAPAAGDAAPTGEAAEPTKAP